MEKTRKIIPKVFLGNGKWTKINVQKWKMKKRFGEFLDLLHN